MFKKLASKLISDDINRSYINATKPFEKRYHKNEFLNGLTKRAVKMYEKQCDINHYRDIVLSDPENTSHEAIMSELFENGVIDPFVDEKLSILSDNRRFLRDLGLTD